jgi:hypothetical protein
VTGPQAPFLASQVPRSRSEACQKVLQDMELWTEIRRRVLTGELSRRLSGDDLAERGLSLACELERLASGRFTHEPNRRPAGHLLQHAMHWFWFLIDPAINATNYRAEQAIRPQS